jgi:hypothetical protein
MARIVLRKDNLSTDADSGLILYQFFGATATYLLLRTEGTEGSRLICSGELEAGQWYDLRIDWGDARPTEFFVNGVPQPPGGELFNIEGEILSCTAGSTQQPWVNSAAILIGARDTQGTESLAGGELDQVRYQDTRPSE